MNKRELYVRLSNQNGINEQLTVAIEELSELTKELTKGIRGHANVMHITEELADVDIVIEQIKQIYRIDDEHIKVFKDFKLKRLEKFYLR